MPGRPSGRSARSSAATIRTKSSTATLRSTRGSASARTSAYAVEVPDEGETTSLRARICHIFSEAQKDTSIQRKLIINLRKIQEACCYQMPTDPKHKSRKGQEEEEEEFEEDDFSQEFIRCMLRILFIKKSEPVGDRIVRFIALFLKQAVERDEAVLNPDGDSPIETPSTRLANQVATSALSHLTAKDKTVRYRAAQIIATTVNAVVTIDDDVYQLIRLAMMKRLHDKEVPVRVQAVLCLGRLGLNEEEQEDDDSDDDEAAGILNRLMEVMKHDPSGEVRRAVLLNIPFLPSTLQWMLERARDSEAPTRRALYGNLLTKLGDFRHMSIGQREKLLRWGLRDRDEKVRKAAATLFHTHWLEDIALSRREAVAKAEGQEFDRQTEKDSGVVSEPDIEYILELLERISVSDAGVEGGMAHDAMREFWNGRIDYREMVTFDADYWNQLTAESAFLARSLNDYCRNSDDDMLLEFIESKLPTIREFAFFVQTHINRLVNMIRAGGAEDEDTEAAQEAEEQEFVVQQMLYMALTLDYSDEMGRRNIHNIMRETLADTALSEECTRLVVEVLRTVCGKRESGEREFCSVVLEAIAEVRDAVATEDDADANADESFHSAQSELGDDDDTITVRQHAGKKRKNRDEEETEEEAAAKQYKQYLLYAKCLHIAQCMLENLEADLESNASLVTMLNTLIAPACRSHEAVIRERGLTCLGLCTLLSKDMAASNLELFITCFQQGHETLQIIAIQVLTDIVITHPFLLAPPAVDPNTTEIDAAPKPNKLLRPITKAYLKALASGSKYLSLTACTAASKLLLMGVLPQTSAADLLKAFTIAYFNPDTASHPSLRQALSYVLPVFCHSRFKNAHLMAQITVPVVAKLLVMREDMDNEDEAEMVSWTLIVGQLAEWTDGRKVVGATELSTDGSGRVDIMPGAEDPHVALAIEILERALGNSCSKDERKPLLTLLAKLHIGAAAATKGGEMVDAEMLRGLHELVSEAVQSGLGLDAASRNALTKLEMAMTKRVGEVEHVTQVEEVEEQEQERTEVEASEVAEGEGEGDETVSPVEEDEDTMRANVRAEGTRLPLKEEDERENTETETTVLTMRRKNVGETISESDIIDSLLESEM